MPRSSVAQKHDFYGQRQCDSYQMGRTFAAQMLRASAVVTATQMREHFQFSHGLTCTRLKSWRRRAVKQRRRFLVSLSVSCVSSCYQINAPGEMLTVTGQMLQWIPKFLVSAYAGYTLVMLFFAKHRLIEWLHSAVSSGCAVLLALWLAVGQFHFQNNSNDNDSRTRFKELATLELGRMEVELADHGRVAYNGRDGHRYEAQAFTLNPSPFDRAAESGLFDDKASFQLMDLADSIRMWNYKTQIVVETLNSPIKDPDYESRLGVLIDNQERSRPNLLKGIQFVANTLGVTPTPSTRMSVY